MTTELEKQFFDTFGIECNINHHQQFNFGQVLRGLEFYKEREKLAENGMIKIWHKMLNPRPENDCVYWGEYHYPQITDRHYLELICVINNINADLWQCCSLFTSQDVESLKNEILKELIEHLESLEENNICNNLRHQVQAIFKGER